MSVSLLNKSESFLSNKAVIGTHDYQNSCEYSFKEVASKEDCEIELQGLVSEESHASLIPWCSTKCQSETGEPARDLEGLQFPFCSGVKEQPWNGLYPTSEFLKAGSEDSDSDSEESDSSVEELKLKFGSQIHISADTYVQKVQEGCLEECKNSKEARAESCVINDPSIEQVLPAAANLVVVTPFPANESTENLLTNGSEKSLLLSQSCTLGSTKLRPALRGGYKEMGLGPRPNLHVTWASDVYEPACTSLSHTVSSNHRRHHAKKDHKHRHKGKISHSDLRKKVAKKGSSKSRNIFGETFVLRAQAVTPQKGKCSLRELGLKESLVLPCNEHSLKSIRLSSTVLPQNFSVNGMVQLGERRLVKLDGKLPFSWHVQSHRLVI